MAILAKSRFGRSVLHAVAALRDHQWAWHVDGIRREFTDTF